MQCLRVNYDPDKGHVSTIAEASPEAWDQVCDRFDNDVHRIMDHTGQAGYSALYACYDEDNRPFYFLVEEGNALTKLRHRTFLGKLGQPQP